MYDDSFLALHPDCDEVLLREHLGAAGFRDWVPDLQWPTEDLSSDVPPIARLTIHRGSSSVWGE